MEYLVYNGCCRVSMEKDVRLDSIFVDTCPKHYAHKKRDAWNHASLFMLQV